MNKFLPLLLIGVLGGCNSVDKITLDGAELVAAQAEALDTCMRQTEGTYETFKQESAGVFNSNLWQRNRTWKHEFKKGDAVDNSSEIRVWKNTGTNLYLLVTKIIGSGASYKKTFFLRIPLASNEAIIDDIQLQGCIPDYGVTVTGSNSLSAVKKYVVQGASGTKDEHTDTYAFNFDYPAFVGSEWNFKRLIIHYDTNGKETSRETYTSAFTQVTTSQTDLETTPGSYPNLGDVVRYCDITDPGADATWVDLNYKLPFAVPQAEACPSVLPNAAPNVWADFAI